MEAKYPCKINNIKILKSVSQSHCVATQIHSFEIYCNLPHYHIMGIIIYFYI